MNIVCITSGKRLNLLAQTVISMQVNAAVRASHHLTIVLDGVPSAIAGPDYYGTNVVIENRDPQGASASRNIGACSIPKYRRKKYLCFVDDDAYFTKDWDIKIEGAIEACGDTFFAKAVAVSGHAHPFNLGYGTYEVKGHRIESASVLSAVQIAMPWGMWDDVGFWKEPGGTASSDDVEWCLRAHKKGYGFAVTNPHSVIHCGLTSSNGNKLVGYDVMVEQNKRLEALYGITGKVHY